MSAERVKLLDYLLVKGNGIVKFALLATSRGSNLMFWVHDATVQLVYFVCIAIS